MKRIIISLFTAGMIFLISASGCAAKTEVSVSQEPFMSTSETETSEMPVTTETQKADKAFTAETTTRNYLADPVKKYHAELDIRKTFYGFGNDEDYKCTGTGPEKPDSFAPPDYYFYSDTPEIKDPELKKLISDFIDSSEQDILSDYEMYCRFNCVDEETSELCMTFNKRVCIINDYCIVSVNYTDGKFHPENTTPSIFEARCGYFRISDGKQLDFSDLFFSGTDISTEIQKQMMKTDESSIYAGEFTGLNNEMLLAYPECHNYNGIMQNFSLKIICPMINPYGSYNVRFDSYYISNNSVIFAEPVRQPESIVSQNDVIRFGHGINKVRYGSCTEDPVISSCPVESSVLTDEQMKAVIKAVEDDISGYEKYSYSDSGKKSVKFIMNIYYYPEINMFEARSESDGGIIVYEYYDGDAAEKLSFTELSSRIFGENWKDYVTVKISRNTFDDDPDKDKDIDIPEVIGSLGFEDYDDLYAELSSIHVYNWYVNDNDPETEVTVSGYYTYEKNDTTCNVLVKAEGIFTVDQEGRSVLKSEQTE